MHNFKINIRMIKTNNILIHKIYIMMIQSNKYQIINEIIIIIINLKNIINKREYYIYYITSTINQQIYRFIINDVHFSFVCCQIPSDKNKAKEK